MERNISYPADQVHDIQVRLAWGHLDILSDEIDTVQLLIAGDDGTVQELDIGLENGMLTVSQPQFGLSLNTLNSASLWLQVCLRLPRALVGNLDASTFSGTLCARTLTAGQISLETVSGALHVQRLRAREEMTLRTVSGAITGNALEAPKGYLRTLSGAIRANELALSRMRASTVSGKTLLQFDQPVDTLELQSVSGTLTVMQPSEAICASLHSLSGKLSLAEGISALTDGTPSITATTASASLSIELNHNEH